MSDPELSGTVLRLPSHLRHEANWDQHWNVDTTRIRQELDYVEPVAQEEALRRTVEWERAHPHGR